AVTGPGNDPVQTLTLRIGTAPTPTSPNAATFTAGTPGTFQVSSTGNPTPSLSVVDVVAPELPAGVTFTDHHNGTGTLASTATAAPGVYHLTVGAFNPVQPNATQDFTLTVVSPPVSPPPPPPPPPP